MTKPRHETWFEARLDIDLALLLNRIAKVHERLGRQRQQEFRERIAAAIPDPEPPSSPVAAFAELVRDGVITADERTTETLMQALEIDERGGP